MPLTRRNVGRGGKKAIFKGKAEITEETGKVDDQSKTDTTKNETKNVVIELQICETKKTDESEKDGEDEVMEEGEQANAVEVNEKTEDGKAGEDEAKADQTDSVEEKEAGKEGEEELIDEDVEELMEGQEDAGPADTKNTKKDTADGATIAETEEQAMEVPESTPTITEEKVDVGVKKEIQITQAEEGKMLDSSEAVSTSKEVIKITKTEVASALDSSEAASTSKEVIQTTKTEVASVLDSSETKDESNVKETEEEKIVQDDSNKVDVDKSTELKPAEKVVQDESTEKPDENDEDEREKTVTMEGEQLELFKNPPFPTSLAKLQKLTVTIGPIQQADLLSQALHEILRMITEFEIKFEGSEPIKQGSRTIREKLGYVRTQFRIESPSYLVKMATLLGNLNISGKDMSVKFPEIFNSAVKDCREYLDKNKSIMAKNKKLRAQYAVGLRKRKVVVKNIPENTSEDTMKALFPECLTVEFRDVEKDGKKICTATLLFETEKACIECFDNNKDVEIGDSKVEIRRLYVVVDKQPNNSVGRGRKAGRGAARGAGGGPGGRGAGFGGRNRGGQFRGGNTQAGNKPNKGPMSTDGQFKSPVLSPRGRGRFASLRGRGATNVGGQMKSPAGNQAQKRKSDGGGPQNNPKGNRQNSDRRNSGSNMGPPNSKRPNTGFQNNRGQFPNDIQRSPNRQQNKGAKQRGGQGGQQGGQQGRNSGQFTQGGNMMKQNQFGKGQQTQQKGNIQKQGSRNTGENQDEDPMAMMMYLKNTIAKMEKKISQRSSVSPTRSDHYGSGDDLNQSNSRKRQGGAMDRNRSPKQQRYQDQGKGSSNFNSKNQRSGFQSMQQNYGGNSSYRDDYVGNSSNQSNTSGNSSYQGNPIGNSSYQGNTSANSSNQASPIGNSSYYGNTGGNSSYPNNTLATSTYYGNTAGTSSYYGNTSGTMSYPPPPVNNTANSRYTGNNYGGSGNTQSYPANANLSSTSNVGFTANQGTRGNYNQQSNTGNRFGGGMW